MSIQAADRIFKIALTSKTSDDGAETDITTVMQDGNLTSEAFRITKPPADCLKFEFDSNFANIAVGDFISVFFTMASTDPMVMYAYDTAVRITETAAISTSVIVNATGRHDFVFTQAFIDEIVDVSGTWAIRLVPDSFTDVFRGSEGRSAVGGGVSFKPDVRDVIQVATALSAVSSHTFSHEVRIGIVNPVLIVPVAYSDASQVVSGVTYNSVSMTEVAARASNGNEHVHNFYLVDPATGANDVVITYDGTVDSSMPSAAVFGFVDPTNPIDATSAGSTGNSTAASDSVTTVIDLAMALAGVNTNQGTSLIANGSTLIQAITVPSSPNTKYGGSAYEETNKTPAGAQVVDFTLGASATWVDQAFSLKPVQAGGAPAYEQVAFRFRNDNGSLTELV